MRLGFVRGCGKSRRGCKPSLEVVLRRENIGVVEAGCVVVGVLGTCRAKVEPTCSDGCSLSTVQPPSMKWNS